MRPLVIVSAGIVGASLLLLSQGARASMLAPTGPGTENVTPEGQRGGIRPGLEASAGIGSGFSGTRGLGYEGRLGYTLPVGVYLGAQVQAFYGQGAPDEKAHAVYFGAEGGYKWFPIQEVEIRPYVFLGPAFVTEVDTNPTTVSSKTGFAVQPGALAAYHMGPAFVGADFRILATPGPFGVSLMGALGVGL